MVKCTHMAAEGTRAPSAEFILRNYATRKSDIATRVPLLLRNHKDINIKDAWITHSTHQLFVTSALSTVFAADIVPEFERAVAGRIQHLRSTDVPYYGNKNRDRIFKPDESDLAIYPKKLAAFDSAKRGTQGEKIMYEVARVSPYARDRDM